jgi:hypothetical protein
LRSTGVSSSSITLCNYPFCCRNLNSTFNNLQICSTLLLTIDARNTMYLQDIFLLTEILYSLTNISPFDLLPAINKHHSTPCVYEFDCLNFIHNLGHAVFLSFCVCLISFIIMSSIYTHGFTNHKISLFHKAE